MKKIAILIGLLFMIAPAATAQCPLIIVDGVIVPQRGCPPPQARDSAHLIRLQQAQDPLARHLFPPDLVMAHQQQISLTDRQRTAIQAAMRDAQARFVDLQFRMGGEVEKLQTLLQSPSVDEARVLQQVDQLLAVEREVKHAQLTLMIRVKNQLTPEQQMALARLRE